MHSSHHSNNAHRVNLPFAMANFPEDYLPYTATYLRNKDHYLVWDSAFDVNSDGHYHHSSQTTASIDRHSPSSVNHMHSHSLNHLYPACSASSGSWPSAKKRKCCGLSCGCCALTLLAMVIISALATVVGFSIYLAMITNLHKSSQFTLNGSFKVQSGDDFNMKLLNTSSPEFIRKANKYETIIKTAFETSSLNSAVTKQEVYAFRKGSLIVFFKLYLDRNNFNNSIKMMAKDDYKRNNNNPFDGVFPSKLLQTELREGISQLKITGTEQIIIDIKSIKVMNELDSMAANLNDIKTGGIASGSKALAPINSGKDSKPLSDNSEGLPKTYTTDKSSTISPTVSQTQSSTVISITTEKSRTSAEAEPNLKNQSNVLNTNPLISSTLSPMTPITSSPSKSTSTHSSNESELNVFTSIKPNFNDIKSTTVPPKSDRKNPFLPFTRRHSTALPVTTSAPFSTNIHITTRSRMRSTTAAPNAATTTTTTKTTTTSTTTSKPSSVEGSRPPVSSTQPPINASNILLKRTEIRDDGLKPSGLDFGQWKPVRLQPIKPQPKPVPPTPIPIPPPIFAQRPPNQMPANTRPVPRPQVLPNLSPQYMPNRPPLRIPIGKPMREVPRLLDDTNNQEDYETPGPVPKEIERHNTSITHVTTQSVPMTSPLSLEPTPVVSTNLTTTRSSPPVTTIETTTTLSDPSMVDGFMVPIDAFRSENLLNSNSECLYRRTSYERCKDFECGVRVVNRRRRRIVGGQSSSVGSWPWQVALYREGEFQCGGVIIESQWLLTAAHCFHTTRDAYWTARFGILHRENTTTGPYEQMRRITHVLIHNDYVDKGFINDIALLRLDSPINYSKHVRPVCMPSDVSDDVSNWHRQLCTTVGWGKLFEHGRFFPDTLQEVKLPVISTEECRKRTQTLPLYKITDNMFCAGYDRGGRDACLGDSGGPLMCQKRNGKWFLLGVTSNGDGCGRAGRPGVYTKVANYRDWIENIINSELVPEAKRTCDGHRCPLGRCLKKAHVCNGILDCRDGSDEQNCTEYSNTSTNWTET